MRGGGFDIYSEARVGFLTLGNCIIPFSSLLFPPPPPTLTFFVTITYIKELRGFLLLVVFIYSLIQNRLYEIVGHFTVFLTLPLLVQF